jgi:hypothetical protein
MPTDLKTKGIKNHQKENFIKSKQKEQLNDLKTLLGSISKMKDIHPDKEMFSAVIKKFIYTIATIPDNYFLSDACESVHEMFLEFRIILGYFEKGVTGKKLTLALKDIEMISRDLYEVYNEFLNNVGYSGTYFPKPKKIKAMRQLADIVKDGRDVVILNKNKIKAAKKEVHVTISIPNEANSEPDSQALKEMINSLSLNYSQSSTMKINQKNLSSPVDSVSTDSSSFNPETSLPKSYDTPLTPRLYSEEVSSIKATTLKMGNTRESALVAAMGELMAPPPPPPSTRHGRIAYVQEGNSGSGITEKLGPLVPSRRSQSLKPPILIDDDGDILPANGPSSLKPPISAASSIYDSSGGIFVGDEYHLSATMQLDTPRGFTPRDGSSKILEDDDSFIVAYRESAMKTMTVKNVPEENKKMTALKMESSGWSLKNRI